MNTPSRHPPRQRPRHRRDRAGPGRQPHRVPVRPRRSPRCRSSQLLKAMDPPAAGAVSSAADDLHYRDFLTVALVVPEEIQLPRQLDLRPLPRSPGRPHPELRLLVALSRQGGPHLPRPRVLRLRGRLDWNKPDAELIEQGKRELEILGLVDPAKVEAGYVVRMPKAYPFYDEHYKANVAKIVAVADRSAAQRPPRRPQRHAPVQQPGPLHVHRHAHGGKHATRRAARRLERQRRGGLPRGKNGREPAAAPAAPVATRPSSPATTTAPTIPSTRNPRSEPG